MRTIRLFFVVLFAFFIFSFSTKNVCNEKESCSIKKHREKQEAIKKKKTTKKEKQEKKKKCDKSCIDKACDSCEKASKKGGKKKGRKKGIFNKKKTISKLEYEELKKIKEILIADGNKEIAVKYIETMVPICTDLGELSELMLQLADLLYDLGHTIKAERLYIEFFELYPGHEKAEYATYRAIVCSYEKTSEYYRDQSKTKETIELAKKFLSRKDVFRKHAQEVEKILIACQEKLLQSEVNVFEFYMLYDNHAAAQTRLENIQKEFLPIMPEKEPEFLTLACSLAEKQKNLEMLAEKRAELDTRFPGYQEQKLMLASNKKKTTKFVEKF